MLRRAITIGAVVGVVAVYLAMVGLVEAFADREIVVGLISLGLVMLVIPPVIGGHRAARPPRMPGADQADVPVAARLASGVLAGAIGGAMLAALVLITSAIDLRFIFGRLGPRLVDTLTFDAGPPLGAALLIAGGAALGLGGAILAVIPRRAQRVVVYSLLAVLFGSMVEPFLRPMLNQLELRGVASFLYRRGALTVLAAALTFLATAAITALADARGGAVRASLDRLPSPQRRNLRFGSFVALALFLLVLPQLSGSFFSQVLVFVGLYLLLALGLNIVVGYAGLLDLGYVAFYAVGAYLTALLTSPLSSLGTEFSFWLALPIVMIGAATTGLLIGAPVLRLRGDYLAIVTLGFGEIARILFLSDWLKPWLGGVQGIRGIPDLSLFNFEFIGPQSLYYPVLAFCVVAAFIAYRLANSRIGRAWNAMREDEQVAQATGINTTNYKLLAFALGATFGCLSGALFAVQLESVFPGSFNVLVSITVLAIIILGGMGSIRGVIVGAFVLIGLPELLREFAEYRLLVYGGVLVAMMLVRPEGLVPSRVRQRELHEEESEDEQFAERAGADTPAPAISGGAGAAP